MKVLIYGAGAIGIAIGTFLIESGADVDYIASEKTYREIKEDGIHRRGIFKDADISKDKVIEQAKEYGHSLKRELFFLVTHGIYHLLGYDHMTEEEEKVMFKKQEDVLNEYGITR